MRNLWFDVVCGYRSCFLGEPYLVDCDLADCDLGDRYSGERVHLEGADIGG